MKTLLSLLAKFPFWFKFQCGFGQAKVACSLNWDLAPYEFKTNWYDSPPVRDVPVVADRKVGVE